MRERIARSRSWASWAPGLKAALVVAVREELKYMLPATKEDGHRRMGHIPYSRECRSCVVAASRGRAHRKIPHPDAFTLTIDAAGPFELAEDQLGKGRYLLVGVYLAPVTKEGQSLIPINEEEELPGAIGDGPELTVVEEIGTEEVIGERWPGLNEEEAWVARVSQAGVPGPAIDAASLRSRW